MNLPSAGRGQAVSRKDTQPAAEAATAPAIKFLRVVIYTPFSFVADYYHPLWTGLISFSD